MLIIGVFFYIKNLPLFLCSLAFLPTFSGSVVTGEAIAVEASPRHHSDRHMNVHFFPYGSFGY